MVADLLGSRDMPVISLVYTSKEHEAFPDDLVVPKDLDRLRKVNMIGKHKVQRSFYERSPFR